MIKKKKLISLLCDVRENTEYYKNILKEEPKEIKEDNLEEIFERIPIITKEVIKEEYNQFIYNPLKVYDLEDVFNLNKDFKKEYTYEFGNTKIVSEYTSGSSGSPFVTFKSREERSMLGKDLWQLRNMVSRVTPEELFYFAHTFNDTLYPFPFEEPPTEPEKIIAELEYLNKSNKSWWHSTAFILEYYYNYMIKHPYTFPNLQVIENSGSYISEEERKKFCEMFSCKIANYYGCREVWAIAYDCKQGHLHINEKNILFQLVDEDNNIIEEPNRVGYVVITSYCQRSMPFIKYKIGDIGYYMDGECSCGNKSRRIYILPGRHMIAGTQIYGNKFFKDVISYMILEFSMAKFHSISVQQVDMNDFVVNIKGCKENHREIEQAFVRSAKFIESSSDYKYTFTYDESKMPKSIFTIKMNKQEYINREKE